MGDAIVRILALHPDVEITSRNDAPFGVLVTGGSRMCALDRNEQAALWHACGAAPRGADLPGAAPELVDGLAQRLMGEGLVDVTEREQTTPARDAHFALAAGVDLRPAFYEVVDGNDHTIHLISELGATLFESCDGRRTVPELHALAQDKGLYVDASDVAKQVTMLQASGLVSRGFAPRRDGNLKVRLKAVVARVPGDYGYLVSADEAELLQRFQTARCVQDLVAVQPPQDRPWLASCVAKAVTFGILQPSSAESIENLANEFDQDNPTEISYLPIDDFADVPASRTSSSSQAGWRKAASRSSSVSMPRPTPAAGVGVSAAPARPSVPAIAPPPRPTPPPPRASTSAGFGVPMMQQGAMPQVAPAPMVPQAPPMVPQAPPMRPSGNFVAQGTPTYAPAMPVGPSPIAPSPMGPPSRPSMAHMDGAAQARLASLQGLSLDKGADHTPMTANRRRGGGSKLPWILLTLVVAGGGYYIYTMKQKTPSTVAAPNTGSNTSTSLTPPPPPAGTVVLTASAYVAARAPITLSAMTSGKLVEVKVDSGDKVTKGQLLAQLDDRAIKSLQDIAFAEAKAAAATLRTTKKLFAVQAKTAADVQAAESMVTVANARAGQYKQQIEDTRIKAPRDATVIERKVQPGETLTPNQPILVIADLSELVAEADINQGEVKQIQLGQECEIALEGGQAEPFKGKVREIAQQYDQARGTVPVKVDILLEPGRPALKPGMSVTVRFKKSPAPGEAAPDATGAAGAATPVAGSGTTPAK